MTYADAAATPNPPLRAGGASLDVLRFLAAGFILLFHYGVNAPTPLAELFPVFAQGWLATDFFLLLSGFILSRAYGQRLTEGRMSAPQFVIRRIARFWPSHVIMLLAMLALVLVAMAAGQLPPDEDKRSAGLFLSQLFLVHAWGVTDVAGWNVPTWTLSALVVCYALFSLYVRYVYNRPQWQLAILLIAVLLIGNGLAAVLTQRPLVDLPFEWGLLRAIPLFVIGSLLDRLSVNLRISKTVFWVGVAACLIVIVVLSGQPRQVILDNLILGLLCLFIVLSAGVIFKENAVTRRMGRASLALFLTHSFTATLMFSVGKILISKLDLSLGLQWVWWFGAVVAAVIGAFLFDALIDKPLSEKVAKLPFVSGKS